MHAAGQSPQAPSIVITGSDEHCQRQKQTRGGGNFPACGPSRNRREVRCPATPLPLGEEWERHLISRWNGPQMGGGWREGEC